MEQITYKIRRSSSIGRSFSLDNCKKILENFFSKEFDFEDFNIRVINHEIPGEFRSVLWRIYLGIFTKPSKKENWISITKSYRQKFDKNFLDENFIGAIDYFSSRLEEKEQKNTLNFNLPFDFELEFPILQKELQILANDYDLFKSTSIKKSFLSIYLIWRINNNFQFNQNKNQLAISFLCKIFGMVIYSLYPCSLHINYNINEINENEEDFENIFYFLNLEDYFEHDISEIMEKLLNCSKLKDYIINYTEDNLPHLIDISIKELNGKEDNFCELFEKKININSNINSGNSQGANFIEEISYKFLYNIHKDTAKNLVLKGVNIYDQVAKYYLTLMFDATKYENIGYYMDNILIYFSKEKLNFIGCLIISLFILLENEYHSLNLQNTEKFFNSYPLMKIDPKEIIGKAMKIREKISGKFE
jgi:hypothetical protein